MGGFESACLLERDGNERVKMHGLIRDMALWIVSDRGREKGKFLAHTGCAPTTAYQVNAQWRKVQRIFVMDLVYLPEPVDVNF